MTLIERSTRPAVFLYLTGLAVLMAGMAGVLAWVLGVPGLTDLLSNRVGVAPSEALALALGGLALLAVGRPERPARMAGYALGALVALIGAATLLRDGLDLRFDLDQLLVSEGVGASIIRMGPNTSLALGLAGTALALADVRIRHLSVSNGVALLAATIALVALVGYAGGTEPLYGIGKHAPMSLVAALALLCLAFGTFSARPARGIVALFTSDTAGAKTMRRLFPATVLVSLAFGVLHAGVREGSLVSPELGEWILATGLIAVLGAAVWLFGRSLHHSELVSREKDAGLARSQALYRRVVEASTDIVLLLDPQGRIEYASPAVEGILGYTPEGLVGLPITLLAHPDDAESGRHALEALALGDVFERLRIRVLRSDGSPIVLEGHGSPLRDQSGRIEQTVVTCRDVTDLLEAEAARSRLAAIVESTDDAIVGKSLDGTITFWNAGATRIFGYEAAEIVGKSTALLVPEQRRGELDRILARLQGGERIEHHETLRLHKDGTPIDVSLTISPIRQADGRVVGASTVARDISERKRTELQRHELEEKLQEAQKLESLGALAGGIAHDFNNILVGILGNAELALAQLPSDSAAHAKVEQVEFAARKAAELVEQILAYAGKGSFVVGAVDLDRVVHEMVQLLESGISKRTELMLELGPDIPAVQGDATQVGQVLINLVANASEALEGRPGTIAIRVGRAHVTKDELSSFLLGDDLAEGEYASLEIEDTGCGMGAETTKRIFDPFFTTKFTGRGLGLAAVLGIVRSHRGAIRVHSARGRGTTFTVLFPIAEQAAQAASAQPETAASGGSSGSGGTVLLVDDESIVCDVTSMMLEEGGFSVRVARSGAEALDCFRSAPDEVDLVLLDMTMPGMSGEEVFIELLRIRPDARVVLSSGYDVQRATSHLAGQGLAGFIQKPYSSADLLRKVRAALDGADASVRAPSRVA